MSLARTWSVALSGVDGSMVEVECDIAQGLPMLTVVGLPDAAVNEARDRVRAAIVNSGEPWPQKRITVGLSPATVPKVGSGFDLAIAMGVLAAAGSVPAERLAGSVLLGELGLDGRVRPVPGVLPAVLAACRAGCLRVVVPAAGAAEARLVPGAEVTAGATLRGLIAWLRGEAPPEEDTDPAAGEAPVPDHRDLRDVAGQGLARRALEVAAAGGHHLSMQGPPGCGKTMLAERLPGLLPDLDLPTALEVSAIHSVAGLLAPASPLVRRPPFQQPHHSASKEAVVGGGQAQLRPGAVSLAHRGVLFLDEAAEFSRGVLEALRQPVESGVVVLSRARAQARFPARFQLVLAANPCPCGAATDLGCTCTPPMRMRYAGKLSGPVLDRVDLQLSLQRLTRADLDVAGSEREGTAIVADRVAAARARAAHRLRGTPWRCNGEVPGPVLTARWGLGAAGRPAQGATDRGALSARGGDGVQRVAWTLCDLDGRDRATVDDVAEALALRGVA